MTVPEVPESLKDALRAAPVAPVLTIEDSGFAPELAKTLWSAGVRVFEVTLRTPAALVSLAAIREVVPQAVVGVGTVATADNLRHARDAGASFALAPGHTPAILAAAEDIGLPLIPGVATPSEMMQAREAGACFQKFFPAEPLSGAAFLRSVAEPLPDIHFWPTGGITDENMLQYLSLANVLGVGSSHLAPRNDIQHGNWCLIEERARKSLNLACDG